LTRVERFVDRGDNLKKKAKGIVILENAQCRGIIDEGRMEIGPRALGNRSILANPIAEE
jgi:predicted NodU family carbamoyl transferase